MKKAFLSSTFATLIALLLISSAKAVTVTITCTPEVIPHPGGTTTITVTSDKGGIGAIRVIRPNGESSIVSICIPAGGGSVSKVYPDDFEFPFPGSTEQLGEYEVKLTLLGFIWFKHFSVTFFVIPESPLGTIMTTTASLVALIGLVTVRRLRRNHYLLH